MLTSKFFAANDSALVLANEKNERFKPAIPPFFPVSQNGRILLHSSRQVMRGYFQIHLSTAVVLMLVLSGFVALNFRPQYAEKYDPGTGRKSRLVSRGWPVSFLTRRDWQDPVSQQWVPYVAQFDVESSEIYTDIIVNILIAGVATLSVAVYSEARLRRRSN